MKYFKKNLFFFILISLISTSCSLRPKSMVSKNEYNKLLMKYESLLKKTHKKKVSSSKMMDKIIQSEKMHKKMYPLVAPLVETINVFENKQMMKKPSSSQKKMISKEETFLRENHLQSQLVTLQQIHSLIEENKFDTAIVLLKDLEKSPYKQIMVRAKFYLGEMLFKQSEYDLAMQVYEEIITKNAFSGLVIQSLKKLIICSDKLKLKKKKKKYYSIYNSFFEKT